MTYCVGVNLREGLVFGSDSRTNAGLDQISRYCKMRVFGNTGERLIVTLSSGNLSVTQNAINLIEYRTRKDENALDFLRCDSMFQVASMLGDAMREVRERDFKYLMASGIDSSASFIVGGQIKGEAPRLFLVYSEGNFIEAGEETPYFQIGEIKYGKPIIDRVVRFDTPLARAARCVMVSFDATMRSNLSVGPPIDFLVYRRDSFRIDVRQKIEESDDYFRRISAYWNNGLKDMVDGLPAPDWLPD